MIVSILGTHGVGKTTTINDLLKTQRNWKVVSEATRHIVTVLEFENAYDYVEKYSISNYESLMISQWAVIDPVSNPFLNLKRDDILLLDRSPIDNLAYYYLLRKPNEYKDESYLKKLAFYYAKKIDFYMLFPCGVFEFVPDPMQRSEGQRELEEIILRLLSEFGIVHYTVKNGSREGRVKEITRIIQRKIDDAKSTKV